MFVTSKKQLSSTCPPPPRGRAEGTGGGVVWVHACVRPQGKFGVNNHCIWGRGYVWGVMFWMPNNVDCEKLPSVPLKYWNFPSLVNSKRKINFPRSVLSFFLVLRPLPFFQTLHAILGTVFLHTFLHTQEIANGSICWLAMKTFRQRGYIFQKKLSKIRGSFLFLVVCFCRFVWTVGVGLGKKANQHDNHSVLFSTTKHIKYQNF